MSVPTSSTPKNGMKPKRVRKSARDVLSGLWHVHQDPLNMHYVVRDKSGHEVCSVAPFPAMSPQDEEQIAEHIALSHNKSIPGD